MKFKLKGLAGAVILALASSGASAAIQTAASDGGSEFYFSAWDNATGMGYVLDLPTALTFENFVGVDTAMNTANNAALLANTSVSSSVIGAGGVIFDVALSSFNTQFAGATDVEWSFGAYETAGRDRAVITRDNSLNGTAATMTSNNFQSGNNAFGVQITNANTINGAVGDNVVLSNDVDNATEWAGQLGSSMNSRYFDTTNVLGSESFMYFLAQPANGTSGAALTKQLLGFDGGSIVAKTYQDAQGEWRFSLANVAAVPEPESYAMMLAGLALLGGAARRRNNKA